MKKNFFIFYSLALFGISFLISACKEDDDIIPLYDTVTDIDGNVYHSVTLGTQVWMLENLKTTRFNNGSPIPQVREFKAWRELKTPGFCWYYSDSVTYNSTDGILYNWYAVNTGKLAPKGWHIPSDEEWTILGTYLGGDPVAGGKMKEKGTTNWFIPNNGATNESGFTALASGFRNNDGQYGAHLLNACFWSSSQKWGWGISRILSYDKRDLYKYLIFKENGHSVRCIRD
jgi:uncharacterized protein (TIGR02145 family)